MGKIDQVWRGELADYWYDSDGILYCESKEGLRTVTSIQKNFDLVNKITKNKPVPVVMDLTHTKPYSIKAMKHLLNEFQYSFKAVAMVSRSPIGKMVGSIIVELNVGKAPPTKVFKNSAEAKKWAIQFV